MQPHVYESIDEIGLDRIETLPAALDFSFGLLRAIEKSIWGELLVRYITVESDDGGTLLAFTPVYVGSNLNFNALLPKVIQKGYNALVGSLGTAMATRVAVVGCLISDRGWIPMHSELTDRKGALRLMLGEIDRVAKQHKAQLGMLKDIHSDFPAEERALMREAGFVEGFSLPTIRINTAYPSFEEYLKKHLSKNGRKHARKQFHKAEGNFTLTVFEDFEHLIPRVFPLFRAVFLKAKYQFEELPPRFFVECARSTSPKTELVLCERNDGRLVGALLTFYNDHEQENKRIGIDYDLADSGLIYNLLNYTGIQRAIARGIKTLWLGQSSYVPKTRLGGELEDQYLLIKAYDPTLKPTLPLQRWWMSRYSAANTRAGLEKGVSI
jgi:hypothetical protein